MTGIGHRMNPRSLSLPSLSRRRVALGVLAIMSILASPALVVYEFILGLALVVFGYAARLVRPGSVAERRTETIGLALLAGPFVYSIAWMLAELFHW